MPPLQGGRAPIEGADKRQDFKKTWLSDMLQSDARIILTARPAAAPSAFILPVGVSRRPSGISIPARRFFMLTSRDLSRVFVLR